MEENVCENTNSEINNISESIEPLPEIDDVEAIESLLKQQGTSNSSEENELLAAWNELRTLLRQLHRSIIPSTQNNKWQNSLKSKPSILRIQYLCNLLLDHDPHQLFTKLSQLSQELCIELKVKLLTTVSDAVTSESSKNFVHGICESYRWVMTVCEATQSALEKLDTDHLSMFELNWASVNMHAFYTTVFTDPDVQDYLAVCSTKLIRARDNETLEYITSLQRTLIVAEELWSQAEINLMRYNQHMSPHRRIDDGSCTYENCHSLDVFTSVSSTTEVTSTVQCPCRSCMTEVDSRAASVTQALVEGIKNNMSKSCECHSCNATKIMASNTVGSTCVGSLPPFTQPQLSLYPHIHGTSSDLVTTQSLEAIMRPSNGHNRPPPIPSHLLGSDVLTRQLIDEWDESYGDAISPPASITASMPVSTSIPLSQSISLSPSMPLLPSMSLLSSSYTASTAELSFNRNDHAALVNGLNYLSLERPLSPEIMRGADVFLTNNISDVIPNSFFTTTVSNHQTSSVTTTSSVFSPISTLNCSEDVSDVDIEHLSMNGNGGVITHTKFSSSHPECDHHECIAQSDDLSTTGDSSSMCDSSDRGDENGGLTSEDYEPYTTDDSSEEHLENHCDCCYCHLLDGQQGGGLQPYHTRRERLLKILARKKANHSSSSSSDTSNASVVPHQDINQIMSYIEGRRETLEKKAPKKKKKKEVCKKVGSCARMSRSKKKSTSEDEDGPLAELRRRAPDVTVTVVKPGERPPTDKIPSRSQISISRNSEQPTHPLMVRPQQSNIPETWVPPTSRIGANLGVMGLHGDYSTDKSTAFHSPSSVNSQGHSINNLLKNLHPANRNCKKDKDGSQMVTIKRVMDPITADPTVTITLKGAEKKSDEVLLQLINGQMPGGKGKNKEVNKPYPIPEGLTPDEARTYKNRLKKERKKYNKLQERRAEEEEKHMQQLHIQKQQQLLLQQEKQIKQQQVALQRRQEELLREQQQKCGITPKGIGKNTSSKKSNKKDAKMKSVDMSKNYTLPPGVSINKVAGQPGMVTISNNLGGPQPFLSNPNVFGNSFGGSYRTPPVPSFPSASMATPYSYGTAWNESNSRRENVIVVDTKPNSSKGKTNSNKKDVKTNSNKQDTKSNSKKDIKTPVANRKDAKANLVNKKEPKACAPSKNDKAKNLLIKDLKANMLKKDIKVNALKKDVKSSQIKDSTVTSTMKGKNVNLLNKKDVKVNLSNKKDVKVNLSNKKDVKVNLSNKKDVKVNLSNKKDVKVNLSNKKDVKVNILNKKDAKPQIKSKKETQKAKVSPKRKVEDMTSDERYEAALNGEINASLLNRNQRKALNRHLETIEQAKAEQREEDELMDKMYNISICNNKAVKTQTKKVQQAVEVISKKQNKVNQAGPVKRLQKPAPQPSKQEVPPKLKPKSDVQQDTSKNSKKIEEPKKNAKSTVTKKKPEIVKKVSKPTQKFQKVDNKPIIVHEGVTRKQQLAKGPRYQKPVEKVDSNRGVSQNTKKIYPPKQLQKDDESTKKKGKASKKNSLDDVDIFAPKSNDAHINEVDREVEAFKRFCLENSHKNEQREKLKINFNMKDIMIKKKHGLY